MSSREILRREFDAEEGSKEPHTPTIAPAMPTNFGRWNSFSATNASKKRSKACLRQTEHRTPKAFGVGGAVPVNQRTKNSMGNSFISVRSFRGVSRLTVKPGSIFMLAKPLVAQQLEHE
jgi:hypothetical protein